MDEIIDGPPTVGQLLVAITGLRNHLDTFSIQALAEIDLMKYWIQRLDPTINYGIELAKP